MNSNDGRNRSRRKSAENIMKKKSSKCFALLSDEDFQKRDKRERNLKHDQGHKRYSSRV